MTREERTFEIRKALVANSFTLEIFQKAGENSVRKGATVDQARRHIQKQAAVTAYEIVDAFELLASTTKGTTGDTT